MTAPSPPDRPAPHAERRHRDPAKERRSARIAAMQALFQHDLLDIPASDALERQMHDAPLEPRAAVFARHLVAGTVANSARIDEILQDSAPTWRLAAMPGVDRAILRLAIFELMGDNRAPLPVVIDEAVELAKAYGGEHSGRFVHGVLGTVASYLDARPPSHERA